jgi:hypothetical protein
MELNKNKRIIIVAIGILLGLLFAVYLLQKPYSSIITYFPYINGSVFSIAGLYLFLLFFKIYNPKYKTEEQKLKVENLLKSWGNWGKFGAIFMILFGAYNLIWHDPNFYRLDSTIENNEWTAKDKTSMIDMCMKGSANGAKKYPQITLDYCTCSVDKIMKSIGRKEFIDNSSKSADEQYKIDSPFIQGCLIVFSRRVDSVKKQGK